MFILRYESTWPVLANSQIEINSNSISGSFQNWKARPSTEEGGDGSESRVCTPTAYKLMGDYAKKCWQEYGETGTP